jgi:hypothetical protein
VERLTDASRRIRRAIELLSALHDSLDVQSELLPLMAELTGPSHDEPPAPGETVAVDTVSVPVLDRAGRPALCMTARPDRDMGRAELDRLVSALQSASEGVRARIGAQ